MKDSPWRRPRTLSEVAEASGGFLDFGYHLKDFLHTVAGARGRRELLEPMVLAPPGPLAGKFAEGKIGDAFLAALADFLARTNGFAPPPWALAEDRVLEQPWFSEEFQQVRVRLLRDAPSAFKDKNIFVFESALQVA